MNRLGKLFVLLLSLAGLGLWGGDALAAAKVATATGNWNLSATWGGAAVPTNADTCTITSGIAVTVNTAGATCGSLTIGNTTNSTTTFTMASPGTLSITSAGGQSGNLIINPNSGSRTYTLAVATGVLTVDGTFTTGAGGTNVISVSTGQITFTRAAGITWPTLGTLNVTGNNAGGSVNFAGPVAQAGGTISNNGGTINFAGLVTQTGGTITNVTTAGTFSFNGGLSHSAGTFTTLSGEILNFGGNYTNSGGTQTFNTGSTENFTNTAIITPTSTIVFGNLVINPGAGKTVTLANIVTAAGNLSVTTGTFDLATFTAARTGGGGTLTIANGATMLVGASNYPTNYATDTLGATSTVVYDRNDGTAQTVVTQTGLGYGNLTLTGSGTKTMPAAAIPIQGTFTMAGTASATAGGALTIGGDFILGTGTTFNGGSALNHSIAGNFTNNGGTFTASTSTITLNGAAPQTIGGTSNTTFNNLTVNGSGGVTLASSPTIGGTLTLTTGTFAVGANTLTLNGPTIAGTPANLTTTSSSNLVFGGSSAGVLVPSSVGALNNLTINNASGVTLSGSPTLSGTLTLTSGTLTVGANTLTLNGPAIVGTSTNLITSASSSLSFGGSSAGVLVPSSVGALNNLTINNANGVTMSGNPTLSGTLTLTSGTLTVGAHTLTLNGPAIAGTSTNLVTTSSSNLSFGGSSTGVFLPSSVVALNNFTVNNANGITLNSSPVISGVLTLTNGPVTTGGYVLILSANCTDISLTNGTSWVRTSGFVAGNLKLTFPGGATTCTYPVGSGTTYAQIVLTTPSGSSAGTMTGSTTSPDHPDVGNSPVDPNKDVNRYWTLSADTIGASSYNVTFWFVTGDVDAGANPLAFVLGRDDLGVWTAPALPTTQALSIAASLTGPGAGVTDFVAGEAGFKCSVPTGSPVGTTCVCDNFNRTSLNPSPMVPPGSWTVSGTSPQPRIVSNRLRLTDASQNVATAATSPGTYPAAGNWVSVEFKHYAYGGNGADGIAFALSDSTITAVPGAYGGSLGYAQKTSVGTGSPLVSGGADIPGFTGGWIGIGIDEFGNFSDETEGRIGGRVPGNNALTPDSVSVRGSRDPLDVLKGYPYLGGTNTLAPPIDNPTTGADGFGYAYRLMVDARNYTWNGTSGTKTAIVSLDRDTTGSGTSYAPLMTPFDAYVANPSQAVVPDNWQLSFTGSTGGSTNIHEIIGLKICAQTIMSPGGYQINVSNMSPTTCNTDPKPTVTVTTLNQNGHIATTYDKTVTLSAKLSGGANPAGTVTWAKITGAGTLTPTANGVATYNYVNPGDNGVASFSLFDTNAEGLYITVTETLGTQSTTLGAPVQFTSGAASFVVDIPPAETLGTGVVAGRAHLMRITRKQGVCGAGTDTTYSGTKALDGWFSPAVGVGEHPSGAIFPKICAPVSGVCLPSQGSCSALLPISTLGPVVDPTNNNINGIVTFVSGVANFCLVTTDVGKYSIGLQDDSVATGTPAVARTSTPLTVRPFAVVVSGLTGNPPGITGTTDMGTVFTSAGSPFPATVGGYLWKSSGTSNTGFGDASGVGVPDAGVNWNNVTAGGFATHYADTVILAAGAPCTPTPCVAAAATLSNGGVSVTTGGTATVSNLSYSEVGSFSLTATPASSYLNTTGVDLSPRVAIFSDPASSSQNKWVGRFKPHHFGITGTVVTRSDVQTTELQATPFTYMDEPMKLSLAVTAYNKNEGATSNYAGSWAKLDAGTLGSTIANWTCTSGTQCMGLAAVSGSTGLTSRLVIDTTSTNSAAPTNTTTQGGGTPGWSGGTSYFTLYSKFRRRATIPDGDNQPDGPYGDGSTSFLKIGGKPLDSEGVTLPPRLSTDTTHCVNLDVTTGTENVVVPCDPGTTTEANLRRKLFPTTLRFGRIKLSNAFGSEKSTLQIPVRAQYWSGNSWVLNSDDSATPIPATRIALSNYRPLTFGTTPTGPGTLSAGTGFITLSAPAPSTGSVDLAINLGLAAADTSCLAVHTAITAPTLNLAYLRGMNGSCTASSTYAADPSATATFGVYSPETRKTIHVRELY